MRPYIKDGNIKPSNQIIIKTDEMQIINPTHEQLLAAGWVEYFPVPTIEEARKKKIEAITAYDTSSAVNNFKYNGQDMWLTREDRLALTDRFIRELERGISVTNLYYNGQAIMVTPQQGLDLVAAVATYADACFDNTQKNIGTVYLAQSKEEVEAIDITQGYPEQLNLSAL